MGETIGKERRFIELSAAMSVAPLRYVHIAFSLMRLLQGYLILGKTQEEEERLLEFSYYPDNSSVRCRTFRTAGFPVRLDSDSQGGDALAIRKVAAGVKRKYKHALK